eukprot:m.5388 g.5388  ORF g.5388 m.5388 type:complete len:71 (-) comp4353_c0_seq1:36-248(-)
MDSGIITKDQRQPVHSPGVLSEQQKEQQRRRQYIRTCKVIAEEVTSHRKQYTSHERLGRATHSDSPESNC